jgi:aspartyl/asparaginyl beta-hydroxylase (cupin superfamily)
MPKTITITCDKCDADITNSSRFQVSWSSWIESLNHTMYFCSAEHMYQYLDERRTEKEKNSERETE